ncbi:MAG: 50S ribosomal protein L23 [Candidatus Dadabacteria bacterium]|nr:MAG: 50S ribosomal protein L23 [Candidatus Dadabacteria bacterium]
MKPSYQVIKAPLITEKGTLVAEKARQVVFQVDPRATKHEIRRAVEELFGVKVEAVRTVNYLGKTRKRFGRTIGRRANWKKAYVTLAEGEAFDLIEKI